MPLKKTTELVERFFAGTGATYDLIACLCTFGMDHYWKRKILDNIPQNSINIVDQACGTGILTIKIAQKLPRCRVVGVELREEYMRIAKKKAVSRQLDKVEFIVGRAENVVLKAGFDCIASSYLAKYAEIETWVENAKQMLAGNGLLIIHDFTYPTGRLFASIWQLYFKILQTLGGRIWPQWRTVFHELPQLLRRARWTVELTACLRKNAFEDIRVESLTLGTAALITARKS